LPTTWFLRMARRRLNHIRAGWHGAGARSLTTGSWVLPVTRPASWGYSMRVVSALARVSADTYDELEHAGLVGFDRVDGLQVATTAGMMTDLQRRAGLAHDAG